MKRMRLLLYVSLIAVLGLMLAGCKADMAELTWNPVNESEGESYEQNNFGASTDQIESLEVYKNQLYVGTSSEIHGPRISRTSDGSTWEFASEEAFGYPLSENEEIIFDTWDLHEFHDQLYAGLSGYEASTGASRGAQVWRSSDGTNWTNVVEGGFGNPEFLGVLSMAVFNDTLYATIYAWDQGFQIWRSPSGDPGSWTKVAEDSLGYPGSRAAFLIPFKGRLVVIGTMWAYDYTTIPVRIWYTEDGLEWTAVTTNGFDFKAVAPINPVIFKNQLYLGTVATVKGSPIWRSQDGISWEPVEVDGFEFEKHIYNFSALFVYDGNLFANVSQSSGVNLYYSPDGETWSQVKAVSHGNDNSSLGGMNPAVEFKGDLYFGGAEDNIAKVWKLCTDCE